MGENILRITTYAVLRILALVSHGENIKETHVIDNRILNTFDVFSTVHHNIDLFQQPT